VAVEPGTALRDVLQPLTLMHEAGIRRFDPDSLLGALPTRADRRMTTRAPR
jgi:hypothetical protein